jgi:hypothetical protein
MKDKAKKDPRFLERDELERELVRRDKQSLISDCLKIFDTNTMLFEQVEQLKGERNDARAETQALKTEVERLKARTLWSILNERIQWRIEKIRSRRKSFNAPVK